MTTCTLEQTNQSDNADQIIDRYAMERVEYQVARLGRVLRLSHHRKEDLRQDLLLELCRAARRFDPMTSRARTFVSRVVALGAAHHARCIRNERRNSARTPILLSQLQREGRSFSPIAPRSCEPSAHDLVLDLDFSFAAMNRRQQELAESLKTSTAAEIAAERGHHRCTVYRDLAAMRVTLADLDSQPGS